MRIFIKNGRPGKTTLNSAITDARQGAEQIYISAFSGQSPVHFQITGSAISTGRRNYIKFPTPTTENWVKTIGEHAIWISAEVDVTIQKNVAQYSMIMTLHAEDRYNFNLGQQDIATGIPDASNGVFEVTGLARQYMNYGTLQRTVTWSGATSGQASSRSDNGRDRKPNDNRRVRNRL